MMRPPSVGKKTFHDRLKVGSNTGSDNISVVSRELSTISKMGASSKNRRPFDVVYKTNCQKANMDPLEFIVQSSEKKIFEIDLDFMPAEHYKQCLNAFKLAKRESFYTIRIAWGESNDARKYVDNRAFQALLRTQQQAKREVVNETGSVEAYKNLVKETQAIKGLQKYNQESQTSEEKSNEKKGRKLYKPTQTVVLQPALDISEAVRLTRSIVPVMGASLVTLELIGFKLTTHCTSLLGAALKLIGKHSLQNLSFKNSRMGDEAFKEIGTVLKDCYQLRRIQLSGCLLTDLSTQYLYSMVKTKEEIQRSESWINSLRQPEKKNQLSPLSLRSGATKSEMNEAFGGTQERKGNVNNLYGVDLSNNYFTEIGARLFSKLVSGDGLKSLNLSKNTLGYSGLLCFTEAVTQSNSLEYLNLSENEGIKEFMAQLGTSLSSFKIQYSTTELVFLRDPKDYVKKPLQKKKHSKHAKKKKTTKKKKKISVKNADGEDEFEISEDEISVHSYHSQTSVDASSEQHLDVQRVRASSVDTSNLSELERVKLQNVKLRALTKDMAEKMKQVEAINYAKHKKTDKMIDELQQSVEHLANLVDEIERNPPRVEITSHSTSRTSSPNKEIYRRLSEMWKQQNS